MSGISERNPFVGPRPIQRGEDLHGRERETHELFSLLQGRRVVVLHSPSGAGKSSLVQAGLIPVLTAAKFDVWRPIRVNLDLADIEGLPAETNRYLLSALVSLEDELPAARRRSPAELARRSLHEYIETRPRRKRKADRPVVLLFDQFEEILTVDPLAVDAKREFFAELGAALDDERYWALFVIREDYLAAFDGYRKYLPTRMSNTFRLDLLGLEGAREAALRLAESGGRAFPAVDRLVHDLSMVQVQQADGTFVTQQGLHVEPVHLQVVCRRLWTAMPEDDLSIDDEDIEAFAGISKSLAGYYADSLSAIAGSNVAVERAVRDWVGTKLIVGGIRSQVRQGVKASGGLDNALIERLLDTYLVRTEPRAGANWFELSHDRLVEPIQEDNEAWEQAHLHALQVQAKLWEDGGRTQALLLGSTALPEAHAWARDNPERLTEGEREFLRLSQARQNERARALRRRRGFTGALALVAVVAVSLGALAQRKSEVAELRRTEAELAQSEAEAARARAEAAQAKAEDAKRRAEAAQTQAEAAQAQNAQLVRTLLVRMFQAGLRRLLEELAAEGVVSGVIELSEDWTPLLEHDGRHFAAANVTEGGGRLVVAGNEVVLTKVDAHGDSLFLDITAKWLLGDQGRRGIAIVAHGGEGEDRRLARIGANLDALSYPYEADVRLDDEAVLARTGMLIIDNRWIDFSSDEISAVKAFVQRGGGVLAVGSGWSWLERESSLEDYPMNRLFVSYGVRWTEDRIEPEELRDFVDQALVRFDNRIEVAVKVFAIAAEQELLLATVPAGETLELASEIGQQWIIKRAKDDRVVRRTTTRDKEQTVVIRKQSATGDASEPIPNTLSNSDIAPLLAKAKKIAKTCGEGSFAPRLEVRLKISPSGKVVHTQTLGRMNATADSLCVERQLAKLKFPASRLGLIKTWALPLR